MAAKAKPVAKRKKGKLPDASDLLGKGKGTIGGRRKLFAAFGRKKKK